MVNLQKRNWRLEIWCDFRMTEVEQDAFFEAVADVVMDPKWPYDALLTAVRKEIGEA